MRLSDFGNSVLMHANNMQCIEISNTIIICINKINNNNIKINYFHILFYICRQILKCKDGK